MPPAIHEEETELGTEATDLKVFVLLSHMKIVIAVTVEHFYLLSSNHMNETHSGHHQPPLAGHD